MPGSCASSMTCAVSHFKNSSSRRANCPKLWHRSARTQRTRCASGPPRIGPSSCAVAHAEGLEDVPMAELDVTLKDAMQIEGAVGVALVDYTSGMALGSAGGNRDLDMDVAAAGNTD